MIWINQFKYWIAGIIVIALLVGNIFQAGKMVRLENQIAILKKKQAEKEAEYTAMVNEQLNKQIALKRAYEIDIANRDKDYAATIKNIEDQRTVVAANNSKLRSKILNYPKANIAANETCTITLKRTADKSEILAELLAEGIGISAEGRSIIERRDAEVARLLDQINLDRIACEAI